MSASHSLPGDVIQSRQTLLALDAAGRTEELAAGFYAVLRQFGDRLVVARVGEDEDGQIVAFGGYYLVPASVLGTEAVGVTYLKVTRWEGREDDTP